MRHVIAALAVVLLASFGSAATFPTGFAGTTISGIDHPTAMGMAPDGRIFVCQQGGALRIIKNGVLLTTPFVTLTVNSSGERGLLGVTFDPDFLTNHFVYVYYTATTPAIHNRISKLTANGDVAAAGETILLDLNNLSGATNHNGGALHFGRDRKLYASVGENANGANSQTLNNLLGKVLRINTDGSIPTDNPFFGTATGNNRAIWAMGLRNPFTFAFHPLSGRMFIDDVGESTWEEINEGIAGSNYGWPTTEGPPTGHPEFRAPLYYYGHGPACAIAGGTFYSGEVHQFPAAYVEHYFFSDLCGDWIKTIDPASPPDHDTAPDFGTGISAPVDQFVGHDGSLYYLSGGGSATGLVGRVRWNASLKGDVKNDGETDGGDLFYFINFIHGGGPAPVQGGDLDASGSVNALDLDYLAKYLYGRGPTPL
ncbi:MAG: PQQ-dependent sugar dehydrogenase [Thermoanaerobaculia bacterium]